MVAVLEEEAQWSGRQFMFSLAFWANYELPRVRNEAFEISAVNLKVCPTTTWEHEHHKYIFL
jgi:hypothetical protein